MCSITHYYCLPVTSCDILNCDYLHDQCSNIPGMCDLHYYSSCQSMHIHMTPVLTFSCHAHCKYKDRFGCAQLQSQLPQSYKFQVAMADDKHYQHWLCCQEEEFQNGWTGTSSSSTNESNQSSSDCGNSFSKDKGRWGSWDSNWVTWGAHGNWHWHDKDQFNSPGWMQSWQEHDTTNNEWHNLQLPKSKNSHAQLQDKAVRFWQLSTPKAQALATLHNYDDKACL
jgi:hypothetical protein